MGAFKIANTLRTVSITSCYGVVESNQGQEIVSDIIYQYFLFRQKKN